jgi:two-component sensor histidine kinase
MELEEARKKAEEQMKASLKEKEVLLREIHHRVKNSLQVISSLLNMQARAAKDEGIKDALSESINRINAISLIHNKLYESENLSEVTMKGFVDSLVRQLLQVYSIQDTRIIPNVSVADSPLPISIAVPAGLIVNELLTNAFKHAFVNRNEGTIGVSLGVSEKGLVSLTVSDDGVGLPRGFDIDESKTLGLHLVKILTEDQLQGTLEVTSDGGATFKIEFDIEYNGSAGLA